MKLRQTNLKAWMARETQPVHTLTVSDTARLKSAVKAAWARIAFLHDKIIESETELEALDVFISNWRRAHGRRRGPKPGTDQVFSVDDRTVTRLVSLSPAERGDAIVRMAEDSGVHMATIYRVLRMSPQWNARRKTRNRDLNKVIQHMMAKGAAA